MSSQILETHPTYAGATVWIGDKCNTRVVAEEASEKLYMDPLALEFAAAYEALRMARWEEMPRAFSELWCASFKCSY
ncbi:hypothetical protein [Bordetella sp. 02P26C-1]|uniref:hypothetical protein n=1 Tax=Bordetella sp. 02P26C-1 TaxID=2683195 RepID=UPI001352A7D1|nr:hypothetical protein [Bordetella sp. 02P26C-1]MVW80210.1 hypothetical protein [Bordetella sp. 02P26C-1]